MYLLLCSWLAKIKLPWSPPDATTPTIPPVSPDTAKFINESLLHTPKDEKYFKDYQDVLSGRAEGHVAHIALDITASEGHSQDPPPLFPKEPSEGGITGWMAVAGA